MTDQAPLTARRNGFPAISRDYRATIIEDAPQVAVRQVAPNVRVSPGTAHTHFKLTPQSSSITPSSDATSEVSSMWSKRASTFDDDDELYNVTDDESVESVEVPLICSASVKRKMATIQTKYPSIIIPSPSIWPTPPSAQKSSPCSIGLSPASKIVLSPARLSMLNAWTLQVPSSSATPSLDGSLTSEELAMSSCPSTPDLQDRVESEGEWEAPVQLDPEAFQTLHLISPDAEDQDLIDQAIEVSQEALEEMQEIVRDSPLRSEITLPGTLSVTNQSLEDDEPISALSVPSPGGFFASLHASARQTWCAASPTLPSTSTAEQFYGVPWRSRNNSDSEPAPRTQASHTSRPTAVRNFTADSVQSVDVIEITDTQARFNESYQDELKQSAGAHFDRTKLWLNAQTAFIDAVSQDNTPPKLETSCAVSPKTLDNEFSPISSNGSPSKKSVRFAEAIAEEDEEALDLAAVKDDPVFHRGFEHITSAARSEDAFLYRQARAEALHVESSSLARNHCNQLQGKYEVKDVHRPAPTRPVSTFLPVEIDDERKAIIANAERERQALDQLLPSTWELQAATQVFGSQLIASPALTRLRLPGNQRVLDFGGQAACDWAWQVATEFKNATVFTMPSSSEAVKSNVQGPSNHQVVTAPHVSSLPFPNDHFDLISARSLHSMLKTTTATTVSSEQQDEYDLVLAEFERVLKPGGYLEFRLLDAELLHPGPLGQAQSVEFAFNLKTRGYDPAPSRAFLPRLRNAGFAEVKRAWLVLPAADVTPRWTDSGKMESRTPTAAAAAAGGGYGLSRNSSEEKTPRASDFGHAVGGAAGYFPVPKLEQHGAGATQIYEPPLTGSTRDVRAMTGLVGSRAWERWVVKLAAEMGSSEERALERCAKTLEECGKGNAGWRTLVGWARKAE